MSQQRAQQPLFVCRVLSSPAWMELHNAFAEMYPVFQQMHHKMGRYIAFALCLVSDAHEDEAQRRQHLTRLVEPIGSMRLVSF